jgi:hypothetical protein
MLYQQPQRGPFQLDPSWVDAVVILPQRLVASNGDRAAVSGPITDTVGTVGLGRRVTGGGTANYDSYEGPWSKLATGYTVLALYRLTQVGQAGRAVGNFVAGAGGYSFAPNGTNYRFITARSAGNSIITGTAVHTGLKCDVAVVGAVNAAYYENGKLSGSQAHGGVVAPSFGFRIGSNPEATPAAAPIECYLTIFIPRVLSAAEVKSLSDNPWQVFLDPDEEDEAAFFAMAAGGVADLAGSATCISAGGGALSTAIRFVGTAGALADGSGALTTAIRMAGSGASVAAASGALTTSIALTGNAAASSAASGTMAGTGAALLGSAACAPSATGALTTAIVLSGAATSGAMATGSLAGAGAALAGGALCASGGTGSLATGIPLIGAGGAAAFAAGMLTTGIRLSGTASCLSQAAASLGFDVVYTRAPAGPGYAPRSEQQQPRPADRAQCRPADTQRNDR